MNKYVKTVKKIENGIDKMDLRQYNHNMQQALHNMCCRTKRLRRTPAAGIEG